MTEDRYKLVRPVFEVLFAVVAVLPLAIWFLFSVGLVLMSREVSGSLIEDSDVQALEWTNFGVWALLSIATVAMFWSRRRKAGGTPRGVVGRKYLAGVGTMAVVGWGSIFPGFVAQALIWVELDEAASGHEYVPVFVACSVAVGIVTFVLGLLASEKVSEATNPADDPQRVSEPDIRISS